MSRPDPVHLAACRSGDRAAVLAAVRELRQAYLCGGPPPPELADVVDACGDGLVVDRGDPALALVMFLFDVLMYIPANLRTSNQGPAAALVAAIERTTPRLLALRDGSDALLAAWAWYLAAWLPTPVPGLAADALAQLPHAPRSFTRVTLALAAASTPEGRAHATSLLTAWLDRPGEERDVAAMVLAQLHADPTRLETTSDAVYDALRSLAARARWDEWEAAPAREHGFYADLAGCLVRAGYARAATTLPVLLHLIEVCSAQELEHVLDVFLKLLYQAHPWPGDAEAATLSAAQREALVALVRTPRAWAPRPRFYEGLRGLGLPLGAAPMATFLGIEPPADPGVVVTGVEDGVLTVQTDKPAHVLAAELKNG